MMKTRLIYLILLVLPFALSAKKFREYDQMTTIDDDSAILVSPPEGYDPIGEETSYWLTLSQIRSRILGLDATVTGHWLFPSLNTTTIYNTTTSFLSVTGGSSWDSGANLMLYGPNSYTGPDIIFRHGTSQYGKFEDTSGNLSLSGGVNTNGRSTISAADDYPLIVNNTTASSNSIILIRTDGSTKASYGYSSSLDATYLSHSASGNYLWFNGSGLFFHDATANREVYHAGNLLNQNKTVTGHWLFPSLNTTTIYNTSSSFLSVTGGSSWDSGANLMLYGSSSSAGSDIIFRHGTDQFAKFDDAGSLYFYDPSTISTASDTGLVVNNTTAASNSFIQAHLAGVAKSRMGWSQGQGATVMMDMTSNRWVQVNSSGLDYYDGSALKEIYHEGNPPTAAETGAWPAFEQVVSTSSNTTAVAGRLYLNTVTPSGASIRTLTLPSPSGNSGKVIGFACKYNLFDGGDYTAWALVGHINGRSNNTDFQDIYSRTAGLLWCDGTTWFLVSANLMSF